MQHKLPQAVGQSQQSSMKKTARTFCDVLVVGGGSAGVAAAIAAGRCGADVVLVEKHGYLGGKATAANVGTICGLYYVSHDPHPRFVFDGFPREFAERIIARTGRGPDCNRLGLHYLPYQPFDFRRVCDQLLKESGVRLFLHTAVAAASTEGAISEIAAVSLDRPLAIVPRMVVDCSGEALCTTLCGCDAITGDTYQTASQTFTMEGAHDLAEQPLGISLVHEMQTAVRDGLIAEDSCRVTVVPGSVGQGRVNLKVHLPVPVDDALNRATSLEIAARELVDQVCRILIDRLPAFAGAHLSEVASEVGIRTGRRSRGKYLLTREHVLECRKLGDSAARGAWPMEKWGLTRKVNMEFFELDDFYDIPSGCLISDSIQNLYFGGRHISADEDAIASARVIGTCLGTGSAAGRLAAGALT